MIELSSGYYAVVSDFENVPKDRFTYNGIEYALEVGVNLFKNLRDAFKSMAEATAPDVVIDGLDYETFPYPVVLFLSGKHSVGVTHKERAPVERSFFLESGRE